MILWNKIFFFREGWPCLLCDRCIGVAQSSNSSQCVPSRVEQGGDWSTYRDLVLVQRLVLESAQVSVITTSTAAQAVTSAVGRPPGLSLLWLQSCRLRTSDWILTLKLFNIANHFQSAVGNSWTTDSFLRLPFRGLLYPMLIESTDVAAFKSEYARIG